MIELDQTLAVEQVHVPAWAWLIAVLAVALLYALGMENGALLASKAEILHEFVHDARHFIAVPCH